MIHNKFMIHYCMIYFKLWPWLSFSSGEWWGRWEVVGSCRADSRMVIGDGCWLQIQEQTLLEEYGNFFKTGGQGWEANLLGFQAGAGGRRMVKGRGEGETQQQNFDWTLICKDRTMNMAGKKSEENPAQGGITSKWLGRWRCSGALLRAPGLGGHLAWVQGRCFMTGRTCTDPTHPRTCEVEASLDSKTQGASSPGDWIGCSGERADIERRSHICVSQRLLPELREWEISILVLCAQGASEFLSLHHPTESWNKSH